MNVAGTTLKEIADRAGLTHDQAKGLFAEVVDAIVNGERVKIRGFGSFVLRDESKSKNTALIKFDIGKALKDKVK
jgi:nucleoid DNA-binding protein